MFSITPTALAKLKELKENESDVLYITIQGGGCSGLSYQMKWIKAEDYREVVFALNDVSVRTDKKSALFLEDVTLDYEGGLNGKGFVWDKPSAKRVCGCGSSFSA